MFGTKQVKEKKLGGLSGINDAIVIRNRYQTELDNAWESIVKRIHFLEKQNSELKLKKSDIPKLQKNIEARKEEKSELISSLEGLLEKEAGYEKGMWETTQKGKKIKAITFKQKFKDSDIEEARYDSMMDYIKQYPQYQSKSSFTNLSNQIKEKGQDIRREVERYNSTVSDYNFRLSNFEKDIQKAEDKFLAYEKIRDEGIKKLSETRYWKSFRKLASEKDKNATEIDVLKHRPEQFRKTLDILQKDHSSFQEIEH